MKGWVYIITNKSMPGILKIGFSMKNPAIRAKELGNTGAPYSYTLEHEVLVENPRNVEQLVHKNLSQYNENKEWFNCSISEAIETIRSSTNKVILENIYAKEINAVTRHRYLNDFSTAAPQKRKEDKARDIFTDVIFNEEIREESKLNNEFYTQLFYEYHKKAVRGHVLGQYHLAQLRDFLSNKNQKRQKYRDL